MDVQKLDINGKKVILAITDLREEERAQPHPNDTNQNLDNKTVIPKESGCRDKGRQRLMSVFTHNAFTKTSRDEPARPFV